MLRFSEAILDCSKPFYKCCAYKCCASPKRFWIVQNLSTKRLQMLCFSEAILDFFKPFYKCLQMLRFSEAIK